MGLWKPDKCLVPVSAQERSAGVSLCPQYPSRVWSEKFLRKCDKAASGMIYEL